MTRGQGFRMIRCDGVIKAFLLDGFLTASSEQELKSKMRAEKIRIEAKGLHARFIKRSSLERLIYIFPKQ